MTEQREREAVLISRTTVRFSIALLILVLIMGAGAVVSSYLEWNHYINSQRAQGQQTDSRLCATLDKLAALKPPSGSAGANPSRAYEQELATTLSQLKPDIGCGP